MEIIIQKNIFFILDYKKNNKKNEIDVELML